MNKICQTFIFINLKITAGQKMKKAYFRHFKTQKQKNPDGCKQNLPKLYCHKFKNHGRIQSDSNPFSNHLVSQSIVIGTAILRQLLRPTVDASTLRAKIFDWKTNKPA